MSYRRNDGDAVADLGEYLAFAVPLHLREIQCGRARVPADWTAARLVGDITRGIAAFASRGDAVQFPTASRKARGQALDGLVTAVGAAVVLGGALDVLGVHLCAGPHPDCPLSPPSPPDPAALEHVRDLLDEFEALLDLGRDQDGGEGR